MSKHLAQHKYSLPSIREGLNKKQIALLADQSVEQVLEEGNVFEIAEALAVMEEFVKSVRRDQRYVHFLRDELAKHHGRLTTASGAKIESCEAGVRYDYSGNAEWNAVNQEMMQLEQKRKMIEEKLRTRQPGSIVVDEETGEVLEGALKKSTSTYRITLSK